MSTHTAKEVARADDLYDQMPLRAVSDVIGVPVSTLYSWQSKGMISTDRNWSAEAQRGDTKADPQRAVNLIRLGYTQQEAADEMGISRRTLRGYLDKLNHR